MEKELRDFSKSDKHGFLCHIFGICGGSFICVENI